MAVPGESLEPLFLFGSINPALSDVMALSLS